MIEKIVLDYLDGQMTEPVYMETPNPVPSGGYILVEKTGSGIKNQIPHAIIAIQSISDSLYKAADLNQKVIEKMKDLTSLNTVSRSALETDGNFTNTATKQYRYQAVFRITYMEAN